MSRARDYCFTVQLTNITFDDVWVYVQLAEPEYAVCGKEFAPTTGAPHAQGYIRFKNAKSFAAALAKLPPGTHLEKRRKSHEVAANYCKKDGHYYEHGRLPEQGKRSDLEILVDHIDAGGSLADYLRIPGATLQAARCYYTISNALEGSVNTRNPEKQVLWYYGPPGSGKTFHARMQNPHAWVSLAGDGYRWFDRYTGQDTAILDEVHSENTRQHINVFHRLLHEYSETVQVKGSTVTWHPEKVIICSLQSPQEFAQEVYHSHEYALQLERRIDRIYSHERFTGLEGQATAYTSTRVNWDGTPHLGPDPE